MSSKLLLSSGRELLFQSNTLRHPEQSNKEIQLACSSLLSLLANRSQQSAAARRPPGMRHLQHQCPNLWECWCLQTAKLFCTSSSMQSFVPSLAVLQARLDVALRNLALWKMSLHMAGGCNYVVSKVPPTPDHSMVLWLSEGCRSIWHSQSHVLLFFPWVTQLSKEPTLPEHQGRRLLYLGKQEQYCLPSLTDSAINLPGKSFYYTWPTKIQQVRISLRD